MPRERPSVVLTMAILNMVVGSLLFLCICFAAVALVGMSAMAASSEPALKAYLATVEKEIPAYHAMVTFELVSQFVLALALLATGLGLMNMQAWARPGALCTAVVLLLVRILDFVYTIVFVNPATQKALQEMQRQMRAVDTSPSNIGATIGNLFGLLFFGGYAVALILVLLQPSVVAAFSNAPISADDPYNRPPEGQN